MESTGNSCWLNISAASKGVIYHWRQSKFTGGGGGRLRDGPKALSEARTQPRSAERDGSGRVRHMGVRGYYLHIFFDFTYKSVHSVFCFVGGQKIPSIFLLTALCSPFLRRDTAAERGDATVCRLSVRL